MVPVRVVVPALPLLVVALVVAAVGARQFDKLTTTNATSRAEVTLNGIFNYFWKGDPNNKNVKFLFACGQLGETGTSKFSQCSCYNPGSCVNCYRWWTAVLIESVATYGILMNTTNHSAISDIVYKHSPYNSKWDPVATCTYVDDFLWYGIAYLRVYDWLQVSGHVIIVFVMTEPELMAVSYLVLRSKLSGFGHKSCIRTSQYLVYHAHQSVTRALQNVSCVEVLVLRY